MDIRSKRYQHDNYEVRSVDVFQRDLCLLFEQLKQLTYLDIHGEIFDKKVEAYYLMVQSQFPNSRINVTSLRFTLWI